MLFNLNHEKRGREEVMQIETLGKKIGAKNKNLPFFVILIFGLIIFAFPDLSQRDG